MAGVGAGAARGRHRGQVADLSPRLDERSRRLWLGTEARHLGYGGIRFVAAATGAAIETVRGGVADLGKDPDDQQQAIAGSVIHRCFPPLGARGGPRRPVCGRIPPARDPQR